MWGVQEHYFARSLLVELDEDVAKAMCIRHPLQKPTLFVERNHSLRDTHHGEKQPHGGYTANNNTYKGPYVKSSLPALLVFPKAL